LIKYLRDHDYNGYLLLAFVPKNKRADVAVILAFDYQISAIKSVTSEVMTALIRLAWWRESIEEIYAGKTVREQPVLLAMAEVVRKYNIPHEYFERYFNAKESLFECEEEEGLPEDIYSYAHNAGAINLAIAKIIDASDSDEIIKAGAIAELSNFSYNAKAMELAAIMISQMRNHAPALPTIFVKQVVLAHYAMKNMNQTKHYNEFIISIMRLKRLCVVLFCRL